MRLFLLLSLFALPCWGHQSSINSNGRKLKWPESNVSVYIRTNTSDLPTATTRTLIQNSIAQWNSVSRVNLTSSSSSSNEIRFQSDFSRYGNAVVGVTEVSSNSDGEITKAIIRLNDNYDFKAFPGLYGFRETFLSDVVTHEIGHFFGMGHSEVLNSTMFYANFSGQAEIGYDDKSGIRTKYDSNFGRIYGNVLGGSGIGVLGAHVQLISRKTGDVIGAVTDENGRFDIRGLDLNDTFYLYSSPVKNLESLPGIYANVQTEFCPASYVGSFFNACGSHNSGHAQGINVTTAEPSVNVGTVSINCGLRTSTDYSYQKIQEDFDPITIFNYGDEPRFEKAFTGYFAKPDITTWSEPDLLEIDLRDYTSLTGNPKYLKVNLISYPLGNQLEYQMDFEQNGNPLPSSHQNINYSPVTETYTTDMETFLPLSAVASNNIFQVSLMSKLMTSTFYLTSTFPEYLTFSSGQHLPYLLIMSIWEDRAGTLVPLLDTESELSDNASCLDAPFTFKVKKAELREEPGDGTNAAAASASCGTIDSDDGDGPNSPGLFIGFALGFLVIAIFKRAKNFLS